MKKYSSGKGYHKSIQDRYNTQGHKWNLTGWLTPSGVTDTKTIPNSKSEKKKSTRTVKKSMKYNVKSTMNLLYPGVGNFDRT